MSAVHIASGEMRRSVKTTSMNHYHIRVFLLALSRELHPPYAALSGSALHTQKLDVDFDERS